MTSLKLPHYDWYPRDFQADEHVTLMSLEAEGAYHRLLDHQWLHGSIPCDLEAMAKICKGIPVARMRRLWQQIAPCFGPTEGTADRLVNGRLERERAKALGFHAGQSERGRLGAERRWGRNGTANSAAIEAPLAKNGQPKPNTTPNTNTVVVGDTRAREELDDVARRVTIALNQASLANPATAADAETHPVLPSAGTTVVADWLRAGIPERVIIAAVTDCAAKYKPSGANRRIGSLAYCNRAVRQAWEREQQPTAAARPKPAIAPDDRLPEVE